MFFQNKTKFNMKTLVMLKFLMRNIYNLTLNSKSKNYDTKLLKLHTIQGEISQNFCKLFDFTSKTMPFEHYVVFFS